MVVGSDLGPVRVEEQSGQGLGRVTGDIVDSSETVLMSLRKLGWPGVLGPDS